jgi:hypothetical protein
MRRARPPFAQRVLGRTVLFGLGLLACHRDAAPPSESPSASTAEADALWALAPDDATVGLVASGRALELAEHGLADLRGLLSTIPEAKAITADLDRGLTALTGVATGKLGDAGLAPDHGAALFSVGKGTIVLLPVVDRDKFLAATRGKKGVTPTDPDTLDKATCRTIAGRYACADDPALFDRLGKGHLKAALGDLQARGDVELIADLPLGGKPLKLRVGLQLARGAAVLRGQVTGLPARYTSKLGAPSKPRVDGRTAGLAAFDLRPLLVDVPDVPVPGAGGLTLAAVARSVAGPLTASIAAGTRDLDARLPLSDPAPMTALLAHCADVPSLAALGATAADVQCKLTIPKVGLGLDLAVEGKELRVATDAGAKGDAVPLTPLGAELAAAEWAFAFWGHGSLNGGPLMPGMPAGTVPSELALALRGWSLLREVGLAARVDGNTVRFVVGVDTAWAYPDDVVAKLLAIPTADLFDGKCADAAKAIADAAPGSPFAADLKAGTGGLRIPTGVIGVLAGLTLPAFTDYLKGRSKQDEAKRTMNRLGHFAKDTYVSAGAFPIGDAALTPAVPCCAGLDHKCPPAAWATDKVWSALDFWIDHPTYFQYGYHSDGKTFTATAVGDLDCDGAAITYTLNGEVHDGKVTVQLLEPPPDADRRAPAD